MEYLLQMSKCSIFYNIFKYMIFQRRQKALLWSKGLRYFYKVKMVCGMQEWLVFLFLSYSKTCRNGRNPVPLGRGVASKIDKTKVLKTGGS